MKTIRNFLILMVIITLCLGFSACSVKGEAAANNTTGETAQQSQVPESQAPESQNPEPPAPSKEADMEPSESPASSFTFDVEGRNWGDQGITVKYPMIVNSSIQEKADAANDIIMDDMLYLMETITSNVDDDSLTIDGVFDYSQITPKVLSICYEIDYYADSMAYPVSLYHTLTLALDQVASIPLSDLFFIDETFAQEVKTIWMYAPFRDLDLEAAGVNVQEQIEDLYTNEELIGLLSQPEAQYYLADQALFISILAPHALGDHLEMAMTYEFLESSMYRDNPVWEDYMFLDGEAVEETVD